MNHCFNALLKVHSIKSRSFSLISLCGKCCIYRVEKSYVDKLVARNPRHFNLLSTSPEFFIDQNQFLFEVSYTVSQMKSVSFVFVCCTLILFLLVELAPHGVRVNAIK